MRVPRLLERAAAEYAPDGLAKWGRRGAADGETRYPQITLERARRWPCEEVWKARKVGPGAAVG